MLQKDPRFRYQTCADLIRDLENLGLTNLVLSFIATPDGAASPGRRSSGLIRSQLLSSSVSTPTPATPQTEPEPEWWYVKALNFDGMRKMTRKQVLDLIQDLNFDWKAEASRSREGEFRGLATYREFEAAVRARVAKVHADRKKASLSYKFKQILDQEEEYQRDRAHRNLMRRVGGWLIVIVCATALGVGGYFAYTTLKSAIANVTK
jgi:hypothetical protein